MTAHEFARLVNTPYPTVAQWLRDGRVPGAELREIGSMKVWLIPKDVLKDFNRPEMGRPKKTEEEATDGRDLAEEPAGESTPAKPKRRALKKTAKKGSAK